MVQRQDYTEEQKLKNIKQEYEILEKQRKESITSYSSEVNRLNDMIKDLRTKVDNLQEIVNEAYEQKQNHLYELENQLNQKINEANDNKSKVKQLLNENLIEKDKIQKDRDKLESDKFSHASELGGYQNSVQETKESISKRLAECIEKESIAEAKISEAKHRIAVAKDVENRLKEENIKLFSIREDIKAQSNNNIEVHNSNKLLLVEISKERQRIDELNKDMEKEKKHLVILKQSVESERESLFQRKVNLDVRDIDLKEKNIKYAVDQQRLIDKQKDIDTKVGKLNELKNQVDSLIKIQEANK